MSLPSLSKDQQKEFFRKMQPHAIRASRELNIPVSVILSQWAHESYYGYSDLAKRANNLGGIKYWGSGYINDGKSGMYANYNTLDRWTDAYIQFMSGKRYAPVRNAGSVSETVRALSSSGYAESGYYGGKALTDVISAFNLTDYDNGKGVQVPPAYTYQPDKLSQEDLKKYAAIGLAVVGVMAVLGD